MRQRLFWLSISGLYTAPVVAGLYGADWWAVAGFAVVFVGFNALMERIPPRPLLAAASIAVVAALALVLLGFGWGLRWLTGFAAMLPAWPWLALALAATALARLAWPPRLTRELDTLIDEATDKLDTLAGEIGNLNCEVPTETLDDRQGERPEGQRRDGDDDG